MLKDNQKQAIVVTYSEILGEDYEARSKAVSAIAKELKVSVPTVRGVLVAAKVYKAKEVIKAEAAQSKAEFVKAMEAISGEKLPSFEKATKKDLAAFWGYLVKAIDRHDAEGV